MGHVVETNGFPIDFSPLWSHVGLPEPREAFPGPSYHPGWRYNESGMPVVRMSFMTIDLDLESSPSASLCWRSQTGLLRSVLPGRRRTLKLHASQWCRPSQPKVFIHTMYDIMNVDWSLMNYFGEAEHVEHLGFKLVSSATRCFNL